jgi:phenylalanyl-tRNA synthetase alpha subunit
MDYEKLTKAELIEELQKHKQLPSVIKQKNKEIQDLKEKHRKELEEAEKRAKIRLEEVSSQAEVNMEKYKNMNNKVFGTINELFVQYGSLLKTLQGLTDSHIFINDAILKNYKE